MKGGVPNSLRTMLTTWEGETPYIGHKGMCGLYGWVFSQGKICRYGYILQQKSSKIVSKPPIIIENRIIRIKFSYYHKLSKTQRNVEKMFVENLYIWDYVKKKYGWVGAWVF